MRVTRLREMFAPGGWEPLGLDPAVARRALGVRAFGLEGEALDRFCALPDRLTSRGEDEDEDEAERAGRRADFLAARGLHVAVPARGRRESLVATWAAKNLPPLRAAAVRIRARGGRVTVAALARESGRPARKLFAALRPGHYLHPYRAGLIDGEGT